jgi:hypothetical protein
LSFYLFALAKKSFSLCKQLIGLGKISHFGAKIIQTSLNCKGGNSMTRLNQLLMAGLCADFFLWQPFLDLPLKKTDRKSIWISANGKYRPKTSLYENFWQRMALGRTG